MSGIRNPQRRALEALMGDEPENNIRVDAAAFYLDGEPIFLLGVSEGIGTCSDLHGIYIGVFSRENPLGDIRGPAHKLCAGLALLRNPTDEEKEEQSYFHLAYMVVEGLKILEESLDCVRLVRTGAKNVYVNTIT